MVDRPLSGIRVTGIEQYIAGPYCTLLLADAGAEIIKIERPGSGDPRRAMPPFAEKDGHKKAAGFMGYNRNKKSLALNLHDPRGQEVFKKLAAVSDVVVENLRPGSLDRQGLGYKDMQALNPALVWAVISGFGRMEGFIGPYSDRPCFDIVAEAMSGIMNLVGYADKPPSWTIYGMADIYSGLVTSYGIMQALFQRTRTGKGQLVDSAMFDNMLALNETMVTLYNVAGISTSRGRPRGIHPRGAFEASDGWIAVNVPDNIIWKRMCELMDRADLIDDPRTKTGAERSENAAFCDEVVAAWVAGLTRVEVVDALNDAGIPAGPVNTAEDVVADPHVRARGMLIDIDDPEVGRFAFARTTPHMSAAPVPPTNPAPALGQHTREILEDLLGYKSGEVDDLAGDGVVGVAS